MQTFQRKSNILKILFIIIRSNELKCWDFCTIYFHDVDCQDRRHLIWSIHSFLTSKAALCLSKLMSRNLLQLQASFHFKIGNQKKFPGWERKFIFVLLSKKYIFSASKNLHKCDVLLTRDLELPTKWICLVFIGYIALYLYLLLLFMNRFETFSAYTECVADLD